MKNSALITYSKVTRSGLRYRATVKFFTNEHEGSVTLSWGPITYWLLMAIYGKSHFSDSVSKKVEEIRRDITFGVIP